MVVNLWNFALCLHDPYISSHEFIVLLFLLPIVFCRICIFSAIQRLQSVVLKVVTSLSGFLSQTILNSIILHTNLLFSLPPNVSLICWPKCCASELFFLSSNTYCLIFYFSLDLIHNTFSSAFSIPGAYSIYLHSLLATVALPSHEALALNKLVNLGGPVTAQKLLQVREAVVGNLDSYPRQLVLNLQLFENFQEAQRSSITGTNAEIGLFSYIFLNYQKVQLHIVFVKSYACSSLSINSGYISFGIRSSC